jgi:hypothetical protein
MKSTSLGKCIAGAAGLIAILAFLAFPWLSLGILGNYTAAQMAQLANQDFHTQQLACLWLELLLPVIAVICVLLSFVASGLTRPLAFVATAMGSVAFLGAVGLYAYVSQQSTSIFSLTGYIGAGFWLYAVSVALMATGGVIQLVSPAPKRRTAAQNQGFDYTRVQRPDERYS